MNERLKSISATVGLIGPATALVMLLMSQRFCLPPWQVMTRDEITTEITRIEIQHEAAETRILERLDTIGADVHRIIGRLESLPTEAIGNGYYRNRNSAGR